ncbi:hypothetical protein BJX63DRAFT_376485 [Aspergillus granulosus]|uniref:Uncharacterized protein n=1 Tax=Aspergillus granulosus TaxID=176169 RepID=A0ABR4I3U4_9EURO
MASGMLDIDESLRRQTATLDSQVSFRKLYRFASPKHRLILGLSTIAAMAAGAVLPWFPISPCPLSKQSG